MLLPEFDLKFFVMLGTITLAGFVRGFAGFGAALMFVPVASALYGPTVAVIILWICDTFPTLPIVIPALKVAVWRSVIPLLIGAVTTIGIGVWLLVNTDTTMFRWVLCFAILISVAILWSGWRYTGPRPVWMTAIVGMISGIMGGAAQIAGPPIVVYWLSGTDKPAVIRANAITYFFLSTIVSGFMMWRNDLFVAGSVALGLTAMPAYFVGIMSGRWLFPRAPETAYRPVAFTLILAAAILSMPVLD